MSKKIVADHVKLKRAYEPAAPDDGNRILIDRLWPRGVKKADAAIDEWIKDIAPSTGCSGMIPPVGRNSGTATNRKFGSILTNSIGSARWRNTAGSHSCSRPMMRAITTPWC
jgi:Inactive DUF488-N3 subclade